METINVHYRLLNEERETLIIYDPTQKMWVMDTMIPKHFRKALKQGWTPLKQWVYDDGSVCGMELTAPPRAITIRSAAPKQMSASQLNNLFDDENEDEEEN